MENPQPPHMVNLATLTLADGKTYGVTAADPGASSLVAQLTQAMQLSHDREPDRLLLVKVDGEVESIDVGSDQQAQVEVITCAAEHLGNGDARAVQLMRVSQAVVSPAREEGALLIHGALIERDGWGVLLAGPGDVGKSTASKRIPMPWRAICDDSTLVVCDDRGAYWAHPWPTWSTFMYGGTGGRWDVEYSLRLKAIFFMEQAEVDQAEPVGEGEAICLLLESVGQAMQASMFKMDESEKRAVHLQRFENVAELMKNVPGYHLRVSKSGAFWDQIDRVLEFDREGDR